MIRNEDYKYKVTTTRNSILSHNLNIQRFEQEMLDEIENATKVIKKGELTLLNKIKRIKKIFKAKIKNLQNKITNLQNKCKHNHTTYFKGKNTNLSYTECVICGKKFGQR